jgi:glycogen operon protein
MRLGVTLTEQGADVAVFADGAERVELCLFDSSGEELRIELPGQTGPVFHGYIPRLRDGVRYGFRAHGPWDPNRGLRWNSNKLLVDPYARAISGSPLVGPELFGYTLGDVNARSELDSAASMPKSVTYRSTFDWTGEARPNTPLADAVIYEGHVKGLTATHPDVPELQRGTYAGMAHPSVIAHLLDLGVTAIQLMPIHHFATEDHLLRKGLSNYWGYSTLGFFAPHAGFSSSGDLGGQVDEFKAMVKALHNAGLEVLLDVVYNHTPEGNEYGPTFSFKGLSNPTYYRLRDGGRHYANDTGTGNTVNVYNPNVLRLVMDSMRYWVNEMHVDGFRFDLASSMLRTDHDVDVRGPFLQAVSQDPVLRKVKLVAEPWDIGAGGYRLGQFPRPWGEWNDRYRDTVRDFWRGHTRASDLAWRLCGSADLFDHDHRGPDASVNFITAHDGFTLRDLVTYEQRHNDANGEENRDGHPDNRSWNCGLEGETTNRTITRLRRRQQRNLLTTLLLSAGTPLISGGDEISRTQRGNNNAYCQDNEISWHDWNLGDEERDLRSFVATLTRIRRETPALRRREFFGSDIDGSLVPELAWFGADGTLIDGAGWQTGAFSTVGMFVRGTEDTGAGASLLTVLHAGNASVAFRLPGAPFAKAWEVLVDTSDVRRRPVGWHGEADVVLPLQPHSAVVLRAAH